MAENGNDINLEDVMARVQRAIQSLESDDIYLFQNNACERAITHRFAVCLEREFPDWNVDCEYDLLPPDNQETINQKYAYLEARRKDGGFVHLDEKEAISVYPDIIVHRRGTDENLLAIEVKRLKNKDEINYDFLKLHAYRQDKHLHYQFALFIHFQPPQENTGIVDPNLFCWV